MALTTDTCYHHLNEHWFVEKGKLNNKIKCENESSCLMLFDLKQLYL